MLSVFEVRALAWDFARQKVSEAVKPVIPMEDEIVHTAENPFCFDDTCGCHEDPVLIAEVQHQFKEGEFTIMAKRVYEIVTRHADEPEMDRREYLLYKELPKELRRRFAAILKDEEFISLSYVVGLYSIQVRVQ